MPIKPTYLLVSMPASPAAAPLARALTKTQFDIWDYSHISEEAFLVATELITNAIEITPNKEIRFQLSLDTPEVLIAAWDSNDIQPTPRTSLVHSWDTLDLSPDHWDNNGGWGLPLIAALATDHGCTPDPAGGKWVWARLKP